MGHLLVLGEWGVVWVGEAAVGMSQGALVEVLVALLELSLGKLSLSSQHR